MSRIEEHDACVIREERGRSSVCVFGGKRRMNCCVRQQGERFALTLEAIGRSFPTGFKFSEGSG